MMDTNADALQELVRHLHRSIVGDVQRAVRGALARVEQELAGVGQILFAPGLGDDATRFALVGSRVAALDNIDFVTLYAPSGPIVTTVKADEVPAPELVSRSEARPSDAAAMRQELLAVLAEPWASAPRRRGEGKKTERGLVPHALSVTSPAAGGAPVAVLAEPHPSAAGNTLMMSLAACGFQARVISAEESLRELGALLVVAEGRESLARAKALAARPDSPPVLLCGPSDDWDLVTGALEGGLFDFVPLPLEPNDLIRKVSRAQKLKR
ncbi:hypothetical protein JQX13_30675 [Archangium violaceum]|uniref:hypothetical protein n=1 Tax=Archangium violaceum TaxID=83451 RepID=UPI00193B4621|nr:hypothetical protein [Archangium violaceum]QRK04603.1 hypothetical protein JQX13_30675 [Archangium violaceum]